MVIAWLLSHLVHVVIICKARTILPILKIGEGEIFNLANLNLWIHAYLPYISRQ